MSLHATLGTCHPPGIHMCNGISNDKFIQIQPVDGPGRIGAGPSSEPGGVVAHAVIIKACDIVFFFAAVLVVFGFDLSLAFGGHDASASVGVVFFEGDDVGIFIQLVDGGIKEVVVLVAELGFLFSWLRGACLPVAPDTSAAIAVEDADEVPIGGGLLAGLGFGVGAAGLDPAEVDDFLYNEAGGGFLLMNLAYTAASAVVGVVFGIVDGVLSLYDYRGMEIVAVIPVEVVTAAEGLHVAVRVVGIGSGRGGDSELAGPDAIGGLLDVGGPGG